MTYQWIKTCHKPIRYEYGHGHVILADVDEQPDGTFRWRRKTSLKHHGLRAAKGFAPTRHVAQRLAVEGLEAL
ncbi:hypothetical protein AB1L30_05515 [Bremerella sp. JC817]|uniref:hypothetical protein n=1 Tax=Bremerella sp. JC817 TaxID=3231756 RepID=UPI00345AD14D